MSRKLQWAQRASLALLIPGSLAMIGHLTNLPALKGLGFGLGMSPLPRVFGTAIEPTSGTEFETFSVQTEIIYRDAAGREHRLTPTREMLARIAGPYARRNTYGAVVSYAPALPSALTRQALHYALISPGTMREALGLRADDTPTALHLTVRTHHGPQTFITIID